MKRGRIWQSGIETLWKDEEIFDRIYRISTIDNEEVGLIHRVNPVNPVVCNPLDERNARSRLEFPRTLSRLAEIFSAAHSGLELIFL